MAAVQRRQWAKKRHRHGVAARENIGVSWRRNNVSIRKRSNNVAVEHQTNNGNERWSALLFAPLRAVTRRFALAATLDGKARGASAAAGVVAWCVAAADQAKQRRGALKRQRRLLSGGGDAGVA